MNRHHVDRIAHDFAGRLGQVIIAPLHAFNEMNKPVQPPHTALLILIGPLVQGMQVGLPLTPSGHSGNIVQVIGRLVNLPDQSH